MMRAKADAHSYCVVAGDRGGDDGHRHRHRRRYR
jgi:hypothetical protein